MSIGSVLLGDAHEVIAEPLALRQEAAVLERARARRLALDPGWHALMSYRPSTLRDGWTSEVDAPGFFLSERGANDPEAELIATIREQFFHTVEHTTADQHARCRFPARFVWLQRQLDVEPLVDPVDECPALQRWYRGFAADSVTIDFASAYLESPSSAFGHTFLRFQREGVPVLLSPTSNYSADTTGTTGGIFYVARGLLGGYPGVADQMPFFRRVRTYGEDEGRDIWEYPLDLDADEIEMLLLHLWEVKDGTYDYWFLGENCSYRTIELVASARPDLHLMDEFPLETLPADTIRLLDEKHLLGEPTRWPSSVRTLEWNIRDFSSQDRRLVVDIASGRRSPRDLGERAAEGRARILAAAADYSSILIDRGLLDLDTRDRVTRELIRARIELETPVPADSPPPATRPDRGHGPHMFSVGWFHQGGRDGLEIGGSGFQHERIDPLRGYERGADVRAFAGHLRIDETGDLDVESLTLLNVQSTVASTIFFQRPAWNVRIGARRKFLDDDRSLVAEVGYSRGWALDIGIGVASLMLGGNLDAGSSIRGAVGLEAVAAMDVTRQSGVFAYQLFVEQGIFVAGDRSDRLSYGLRLGVPLSTAWNIVAELGRAGADRHENAMSLTARWFF